MTNSEKNCAYDPRRCREVWQRVCPGEDVYPALTPSAEEQELALPGAQQDPCCMGSGAVETVEVLQGFLREELGDAQLYAHLASVLPREMRGVFRAISEDEKRHARDLAAAIYLITGKTCACAWRSRTRAISARCCASATTPRPAAAITMPARGRRRSICASVSSLRR